MLNSLWKASATGNIKAQLNSTGVRPYKQAVDKETKAASLSERPQISKFDDKLKGLYMVLGDNRHLADVD